MLRYIAAKCYIANATNSVTDVIIKLCVCVCVCCNVPLPEVCPPLGFHLSASLMITVCAIISQFSGKSTDTHTPVAAAPRRETQCSNCYIQPTKVAFSFLYNLQTLKTLKLFPPLASDFQDKITAFPISRGLETSRPPSSQSGSVAMAIATLRPDALGGAPLRPLAAGRRDPGASGRRRAPLNKTRRRDGTIAQSSGALPVATSRRGEAGALLMKWLHPSRLALPIPFVLSVFVPLTFFHPPFAHKQCPLFLFLSSSLKI